MNLDRAVFLSTGVLVLVSLALGAWWTPYWYLLTAFVGLNLLLVGSTGVCLSAVVMKTIGLKPGSAVR